MIITIDGPSGTGKSTVAKGVAKKLGFKFFDTGAMYRSFAWLVLKQKVDPLNQTQVEALIGSFDFEIQTAGQDRRYFVQGTEITKEIRSQAISMAASQVAVYPLVREAMVKIQRRFGKEADTVFEGRDMGTVVFPEAELKIFLTAAAEVRAERRHRELLHKFPDLSFSFEAILKEIQERDEADSNRTISPLKKANDAILIDTSHLSAQQVIDRIVAIQPKWRYPKMKFAYKVVYTLARFFFRCCFRLKIYGLEHFRPGAAVIVANHTSFYDPPVLSISCPEEVHFLAKQSLFKVPFLGALIHRLNAHPVTHGASDAVVFRMMIELLQEGKKLILFPEGKRSPTGDLLPLERGLGFLVQKAGCRIIPAYIDGAFAAWPASRKSPKLFGRMSVVFGSPVEWPETSDRKADQLEITARTEQALYSLKEWFESGAHGSPP